MMIPPSILLGFEYIDKYGSCRDRSRFMYTDGVSGYVKVIQCPNVEQEKMGAFLQSHC